MAWDWYNYISSVTFVYFRILWPDFQAAILNVVGHVVVIFSIYIQELDKKLVYHVVVISSNYNTYSK